jgi:hypothetical protein
MEIHLKIRKMHPSSVDAMGVLKRFEVCLKNSHPMGAERDTEASQ